MDFAKGEILEVWLRLIACAERAEASANRRRGPKTNEGRRF
jgi:hypothetical protein